MANFAGKDPQHYEAVYQEQPIFQTIPDEGNSQNFQQPFQQYVDYPAYPAGNTSDPSEEHLRLLRLILNQLVKLETKLENRTTKTAFIWNAFLQTIGLLIGVAFGAFAILSYSISQTANTQSFVANQLAVLNLCLTAPDGVVADLCRAISHVATTSLPSLAVAVFGPSATATSPFATASASSIHFTSSGSVPVSGTTNVAVSTPMIYSTTPAGASLISAPGSSSSSGATLQPYAIIGIVLGVVAFLSIATSTVIFIQRFRKRSAGTKSSG